jgi:hypothetical protein
MNFARSCPAEPQSPAIRRRIIVALLMGMAAGILCTLYLQHVGHQAADFTWPWRGARQFMDGLNPYRDPTLGKGKSPYPADDPLFYPLPTLLLVAPLAPFPAPVAGGIFMGASTGLLAFALTKHSYKALVLFFSLPFWNAFLAAQWAPLLTALVLLPALAPIALAKPSSGLAVFVARPSLRTVLVGLIVLGISILLLPTWPWDWWTNTRILHKFIPILHFPGSLLALALVSWRDWRARLLFGMAIAPQASYDLLPLWVIPRTTRQSLLLTALSWGAYFCAQRWPEGGWRWPLVGIYLPALAFVLWPTMGAMFTQWMEKRTWSIARTQQ